MMVMSRCIDVYRTMNVWDKKTIEKTVSAALAAAAAVAVTIAIAAVEM